MSVPRYQQGQVSPSVSFRSASTVRGSELTVRSVEAKGGGEARIGGQNYAKTKASSKSLLARPVRVGFVIPEERLPVPEVVGDLELKQALMLLQPGASKEHVQKALDVLDVYLRKGGRAPEVREELYKAAELIFEGKMESENRVVVASRLIYLAERLDGWRAPGRLVEKAKHEFVGRVYAEIEKQGKQKMLFGEYIDPTTKAVYQSCESVFQETMLSQAYFAMIDQSHSIDEMQIRIEWAFQDFFVYSGPQDRAIYFYKINRAIEDGSITQDQLIHHFELIKHAIDLGFLKVDDPDALSNLLGLGNTVKVLFAVGNIEMALFALGNRLVSMDVGNVNLLHYEELLGIVEECLRLALSRGDEYAVDVLCDKLKYFSEMTSRVDLDRYTYARHIAIFKNIEKMIDDRLRDDSKNENWIRAKLKVLGAEMHFLMEKGKQVGYASERNVEDLDRFFDESNLTDTGLLSKKLQWAVDEGLVFFSDVFEQRAEDLLYGFGMGKDELEMAAKFFVIAARHKVGNPLVGLKRAIIAMRANSMDDDIIQSYEKQLEELIGIQQMVLAKAGYERALEVLKIADKQMKEGDLLGASMSYLLLAKSNLSSAYDIFGIWSENKRVKAEVAKLVDLFGKSEIEEDRLWGKQLRALFDKAVRR